MLRALFVFLKSPLLSPRAVSLYEDVFGAVTAQLQAMVEFPPESRRYE